MRARRAIEKVWSWLGGDRREVEILTVLLLIQLTTLLLPQSPVPATQSAVFTQWIAQLRPTFGSWTHLLSTLGLLTIRSSMLFRAILACLSLLVAVRIDALRESWHRIKSTQRNATLLFCFGSILILSGWAMQMLWGWAVPEVVNWPNNPIVLTEQNLTLSPMPPRRLLWSEEYGVYLIRTGWTVGLDITATDEEGQSLSMLRSSKDELHQDLQITLTGIPPEAFFLTPETELVYRLHQLETKTNAPIFIQVYRSASGDLLAEVPLENSKVLVVETTHISVERIQLPRYRVVSNPGAPIEAVGLVLLGISIILHSIKSGDSEFYGDDTESKATDIA